MVGGYSKDVDWCSCESDKVECIRRVFVHAAARTVWYRETGRKIINSVGGTQSGRRRRGSKPASKILWYGIDHDGR